MMTSEERLESRRESRRRSAKKHAEKIAAYQKKYREANKEKTREYNKQYRSTHPPKPRPANFKAKRKPYLREFHLKQKYGIDEAGYQEILAAQGGKCAICGTNNPHGRRHNRFHVDHCHENGFVRGLLCSRCNMGIGSFLDSPVLMQKAIEYLVTKGMKHAG